MFCHQCGKEVGDAKFCPYCGAQVQGPAQTQRDSYEPLNNNNMNYNNNTNYNNTNYVREDDAPHGGYAVLSFFLPIVGLILYIIWYKDFPLKAKSCLKGMITGFVTGVVIICCIISAFSSLVNEIDNEWNDDFYFNAVVETVPYE